MINKWAIGDIAFINGSKYKVEIMEGDTLSPHITVKYLQDSANYSAENQTGFPEGEVRKISRRILYPNHER